mgnify:CR=1 FL=1
MDLDSYILSHIDPEGDYLHRLWRDTQIKLSYGQMASGHLQGRLLKMLVQMIRPKRVLELGMFSGYSALSMAEVAMALVPMAVSSQGSCAAFTRSIKSWPVRPLFPSITTTFFTKPPLFFVRVVWIAQIKSHSQSYNQDKQNNSAQIG